MTSEVEWSAITPTKRAEQVSRTPAEWILPQAITSRVSAGPSISAFDLLSETTLLTPREHELTENYDATSLLAQMSTGRVTSVEVTMAFCKRAAIAHQLTNSLTESFFDKALRRAADSSGEGALVGFRGSVLGAGSDIGGSIRVPSLCCGACGFKPSVDRLPWAGQQEFVRHGCPGVLPTNGPHAASARNLILFIETIISAEPWRMDPTSLAIRWREVPRKTQLRIEVWLEDPEIPVMSPVLLCLKTAADKLARAGHHVTFLDCPSLAQLARVATLGYQHLIEGNEQPIQAVLDLAKAHDNDRNPVNLESVWKFVAGKEDFLRKWGAVWRENSLDVLICPGSRQVAPPHNHYGVSFYTLI
ncbi:amidase signature domain-containing protein [Aspergillus multicolor]|uniref:amidase signature domain-containing protein n=1 Tax=Aspergillus multicolor TaxID=41759 RepID=UPI003CCD178F